MGAEKCVTEITRGHLPINHFSVEIKQKGKNMHKTDSMIKDKYEMYFTCTRN
jgi:hypothetical protein